ncbi:class 1 isoprenoid biosynthesis enzyme [Sporosarcina sp. FSL K6-3457]|uniref:class 1 isoprenoid biosynthesis enzyme n=1 Tax=Sporosarcina sp. FSL K6-3457 TaxID=2978204 RepID=UPI0030F8B915
MKEVFILSDYNSNIKERMVQAVHNHFHQSNLNDIAIQSIRHKEQEGFLFGELTLLHHKMFGGTSSEIYQAAATVELLILSFDLFDDLQDDDSFGTPWSTWDSALTLNLALGLLQLSTKMMHEIQFPNDGWKCFERLNLVAINGQHADILNNIETEEQYLQTTAQKAGSLVAMASLVGTSLATEQYHDIVENYCTQLGIAEQIKNDVNDILSVEKSDWLLRKKSLPILYLFDNNIESDILNYYKGTVSLDELQTKKELVKEILFDSGSMMYAQVILRKHQLSAIEQLRALPVNNMYKETLINLFKTN